MRFRVRRPWPGSQEGAGVARAARSASRGRSRRPWRIAGAAKGPLTAYVPVEEAPTATPQVLPAARAQAAAGAEPRPTGRWQWVPSRPDVQNRLLRAAAAAHEARSRNRPQPGVIA